MIHIVFNEADVKVLNEVIEMDETLTGEVIQIKDDYAVGPISDIYNESGRAARNQWWHELLTGTEYEGKADSGEVNDDKTVAEITEKLNNDPEETVWIWAAQNGHDVSGYYWLLNSMKEYTGRVFILYLNNLPFINNAGNIFYPEWIHEIPAKEFLKAKKLAREITPSEFEVDPDEWNKLMNDNNGVRRLEGGKKLSQHDADYFDSELKKFITKDWQKVSKVMSQYFSKSKLSTGDVYLLGRLRTMADAGSLQLQGDMKKKDFEVRLPGE